jgi:hypothetical protein
LATISASFPDAGFARAAMDSFQTGLFTACVAAGTFDTSMDLHGTTTGARGLTTPEILLGLVVVSLAPLSFAAQPPSNVTSPPSGVAASEPGVVREEYLIPEHPETRSGRVRYIPLRADPPPREEILIFEDSLNALSISNQGNWTHQDNSAKPTAWHLDTFYGCQNTAWWAGRIDSTWTFDSNRAGYDNNWIQYLQNGAWLDSLPVGQQAKLGFRHHVGLTATASGFYAPQGRAMRTLPVRYPELAEELRRQRVANLEMESSALFVLAGLAGLRSGTICAAYAQRTDGTFLEGAAKEAAEARCIDAGLAGIHLLREIDSGKRADPLTQWPEEAGGMSG